MHRMERAHIDPDFARLCTEAQIEGLPEVVIQAPHLLGRTYDEVMASLHRLAAAGLSLRIARTAP